MSGSAPFVVLKTDLFKDERLHVIADVCGYNRFEAAGRLMALWCYCTDRRLKDAPEGCPGHAVDDAVIVRFMGQHGVRAMLGDGCDALAMGERWGDAGLVLLRGSEEFVSRMRKHLSTVSAGGRARVSGPRAAGRFVAGVTDDSEESKSETVSKTTTNQLSASSEPPVSQLSTSSRPAGTSDSPLTTHHSPDQKRSPSGKNKTPSCDPKPKSPAARVMEHWNKRFRETSAADASWLPPTQRLLDGLIKAHGPDEVIRRMNVAFDTPLDWPRPPYDFDTIAKHFDKFAQAPPTKPAGRSFGPVNPNPTANSLAELARLEAIEREEREAFDRGEPS